MKKESIQIRVSKQLKEELQLYAASHNMSIAGLFMVSVAFQNPELKDAILRER